MNLNHSLQEFRMNLVLVLISLPFLCAFTFNPMSQSIMLGEGQKSAQFLLENDGNENMAIELSVSERKMNEKGEEELPETSELSIFPPQLIIPPKEKRTIRVNWNGPTNIKDEKAFRVIAEQLPLKVDPKIKRKSGIQMLMKYMAALYVTPPDVESKIEVISHSSDGKELKITIQNHGGLHQILAKPEMTFAVGKKKQTLKADELKGLSGENVLAHSKRIFIIKSAVKINKEAKATIKINE